MNSVVREKLGGLNAELLRWLCGLPTVSVVVREGWRREPVVLDKTVVGVLKGILEREHGLLREYQRIAWRAGFGVLYAKVEEWERAVCYYGDLQRFLRDGEVGGDAVLEAAGVRALGARMRIWEGVRKTVEDMLTKGGEGSGG